MDAINIPDMTSLRQAIDALDDRLVPLLAERLALIRRASELKQHPDQARVPWRVEQVAARVREQAAVVGFDPDLAETIWRSMMECCIAFEEKRLSERTSSARTDARSEITP